MIKVDSRRMRRWPATAMLVMLAAMLAGPIVIAIGEVIPSARGAWSAPTVARAGRSLGCAAAVALGATMVAWPIAWASRRVPTPWLGVLLLPMLLPNYLAYAGWSVLRDPSTPTGDWLIRIAPPDMLLSIGRAMALLGLTCWAWPLAWICLWSGVRRIEPGLLDALSLEGASLPRRFMVRLGLIRRQIAMAFVLVLLVMLGNPVPFDLAQIDTLANAARAAIAMGHVSEAWAISLPIVALAAFAAAAIMLGIGRRDESESRPVPRTPHARDIVPISLALGASVIVPAALFVASVRSLPAALRAIERLLDAMASSLMIGLIVAAGGVLLYLATFASLAWGRGARVVARSCVALLFATALVPGVLVGSAFAAAGSGPPIPRWAGDSGIPLIAAHLARFGILPALVATLAWLGEGKDLARQRRLDGADRTRGLFLMDIPAHATLVLGVAGAMIALSVHEIESSVLLTPPGSRALSQVMLSRLHFQRQDDLAAGVLLVVAVGAVGAVLGAMAFGRTMGTLEGRRP